MQDDFQPRDPRPEPSEDLGTSIFDGIAEGAKTVRCLGEIIRDILDGDMQHIETPRLVGDWWLPLTAGERVQILSRLLVEEMTRNEEDLRQARSVMVRPTPAL